MCRDLFTSARKLNATREKGATHLKRERIAIVRALCELSSTRELPAIASRRFHPSARPPCLFPSAYNGRNPYPPLSARAAISTRQQRQQQQEQQGQQLRRRLERDSLLPPPKWTTPFSRGVLTSFPGVYRKEEPRGNNLILPHNNTPFRARTQEDCRLFTKDVGAEAGIRTLLQIGMKRARNGFYRLLFFFFLAYVGLKLGKHEKI